MCLEHTVKLQHRRKPLKKIRKKNCFFLPDFEWSQSQLLTTLNSPGEGSVPVTIIFQPVRDLGKCHEFFHPQEGRNLDSSSKGSILSPSLSSAGFHSVLFFLLSKN